MGGLSGERKGEWWVVTRLCWARTREEEEEPSSLPQTVETDSWPRTQELREGTHSRSWRA